MKLHLLTFFAAVGLSANAFAADELDGLLGYAATSAAAPAEADSALDEAITEQLQVIDTQMTTELAPARESAAAAALFARPAALIAHP